MEEAAGPSTGRRPAPPAPESGVLDRLAALQRGAGNAAVVRFLSPPKAEGSGSAAEREDRPAGDEGAS
ncbi:hypothetical protein STRTUCAR8_06120 [Streptomyces turgidiscabies Car8]|uniref:Uncharacterized protein n=1 Tax=Streptomyces turgidiscabies (strain Car8) TaxID=698760 RepID=L7ES29_STRT8|nr:hypothetical protein STRTUCAR8_06120 [Streptomyces turgidiscabies Car8]